MSNPYQDWSTEKLQKHSELMWQVLSRRKDNLREQLQKNLNVDGITAKDFVVVIWTNGGDSLYYSFRLIHEGKEYDIYYDGIADYNNRDKDNRWGYRPWWPIDPNEEDDEYAANGAFLFIPDGFSEAMENAYDFDGTKNQAIKKLKSLGFVNIKDDSNLT